MASPPSSPPTKTLRATGPAIIVILIIAAALIGYYQVVYYPTIAPSSTSSTSTQAVPATKYNVTVTIPPGASAGGGKPLNNYFDPDSITVYIGYNSTVIWRNNDSALHTVTAAANSPDPRFNAWGPDNPASYNNVNPNGGTVNFTFTVAGTYNYSCSYHNWMIGQVIVKTAPPSLSTGSSATGTASTGSVSAAQTGTSTSSSSNLAATTAAAIAAGFHLLNSATDLATSLATRIGSGTAPWIVNLSSNLWQTASFAPADLTKTW